MEERQQLDSQENKQTPQNNKQDESNSVQLRIDDVYQTINFYINTNSITNDQQSTNET